MTGTLLDLTPFGPFLSILGMLYWTVALGLLALAMWLPNAWWAKLICSAAVCAVFAYPVVRDVIARNEQREQANARLAESMALFEERCKSAGEKITRTVDDVEGVVWIKWREAISNADNSADQFKLNDPYGHECGLEDCISMFLRIAEGASLNVEAANQRTRNGYYFVESIDPADRARYRYKGVLELAWGPEAVERHRKERGGQLPPYSFQFKLRKVPITEFQSRYGVTWDDISTRADREHWIAGSSLKVVDLTNGEMIAERVGFMVDVGQGRRAGFRSPWLAAKETACPPFIDDDGKPTRVGATTRFVRKVLRPAKGEKQ